MELPVGATPVLPQFGSDVVAQTLRDVGIPWIALNPGASFRGLHDSLVNFLGNRAPQLLLCLHEEHAVAIAHGYAKVTGKPIAVAVHANVGLFHATMAIFNAWCDRMPVVVLGATGPLDAMQRRPWIDWIHTARDQGALVRSYVKWDDQPSSPGAAREALLRAVWLAQTAPQAPVYVNLDAHMQEAPLASPLPPLDINRYLPAITTAAAPTALAAATALLDGAGRPVILMGRVSRDPAAWDARVALAERLQARVITDLKVGAAFPTAHPLHVNSPAVMLPSDTGQVIAHADVILSLDWVDLAGTLATACGGEPRARVIQVSLDHQLHNGWSMDYQGLPPIDVFIEATPDAVVPALTAGLVARPARVAAPAARPAATPASATGPLTTDDIALTLRAELGDLRYSLAHLPLSWNAAKWTFAHPLDFLGSDGGGGIGAGPGLAIGAALALRDRGERILPVAICGDGDFLMGSTALWTAVHYRIPLLLVVANNQSFYNDEVHQERVARARQRPVENKWIGQKMNDPDLDLAGLARAQGAKAWGPIQTRDALAEALRAAIAAVQAGSVCVVDVRVQPGYTPSMIAGLTPGAGHRG